MNNKVLWYMCPIRYANQIGLSLFIEPGALSELESLLQIHVTKFQFTRQSLV